MTRHEQTARARRAGAAAFVGTTIEWYDFYIYATAASLVFGTVFFPESDRLTGIAAAFATYAVGFFARPVGAVIFGHVGDRVGRRSALVITLMLMGVATFVVGLLPSYASIGVLAPIMLVVLRFVQGIAVVEMQNRLTELPGANSPNRFVVTDSVKVGGISASGERGATTGCRCPA